MKTILLIVVLISSLWAEFRRDSSRNIVIDLEHMMIWQDNDDVIKIKKTHKDAIKYCEDLNFAGASDWRLPSIKELELIVDKNNHKDSIKKVFRYSLPEHYWAKESLWRSFHFYAKYMNFTSGTPYFYNRDYEKYVRCVRDIK